MCIAVHVQHGQTEQRPRARQHLGGATQHDRLRHRQQSHRRRRRRGALTAAAQMSTQGRASGQAHRTVPAGSVRPRCTLNTVKTHHATGTLLAIRGCISLWAGPLQGTQRL